MNLRKKNVGAIFLILIIILIVATCMLLAMSLRKDTVAAALSSDQVVRVLFVVEDDEKNALFTNVLIYYPESGRAAVVNIPGNIGYKKIFDRLGHGRADGIDAIYREKGIDAYRDEINSLLDIRIPFTVVFTHEKFVRFTDLLGGMRLFVPEPVDITDGDGERYLLPSGAVVLDGDKVTSYLSYRLENENYSSVYERYQNVMVAMLVAIRDKIPVFFTGQNFKIFNDCIDVNLNYEDSYNLFSLISGINTEYIIRQTVTGTVRVTEDSKSLLLPLNNGEFIKQVISQTTNMIVSSSGTMAGRVYVIEVQNGTSRQGLARNTQILFENAGYEVIRAVNADRNDYVQTAIIDHIGNMEAAMMVGDFIHCTNIVEEEVGGVTADKDFTLILGQDFDGRYVRSR